MQQVPIEHASAGVDLKAVVVLHPIVAIEEYLHAILENPILLVSHFVEYDDVGVMCPTIYLNCSRSF